MDLPGLQDPMDQLVRLVLPVLPVRSLLDFHLDQLRLDLLLLQRVH